MRLPVIPSRSKPPLMMRVNDVLDRLELADEDETPSRDRLTRVVADTCVDLGLTHSSKAIEEAVASHLDLSWMEAPQAEGPVALSVKDSPAPVYNFGWARPAQGDGFPSGVKGWMIRRLYGRAAAGMDWLFKIDGRSDANMENRWIALGGIQALIGFFVVWEHSHEVIKSGVGGFLGFMGLAVWLGLHAVMEMARKRWPDPRVPQIMDDRSLATWEKHSDCRAYVAACLVSSVPRLLPADIQWLNARVQMHAAAKIHDNQRHQQQAEVERLKGRFGVLDADMAEGQK